MRIIIIFLIYIQYTFISNLLVVRSNSFGPYIFDNYNNWGYDDDGDNCHGHKCNKSNNKNVNNIISVVKGGAKMISEKTGTLRLTKNGKISPKYYESGWHGGSKAKIKTYNI